MGAIRVDANPEQASAWIDAKARKQVPFATALALTRTAKGAADQVRAHLGERFTIRTPWLARGIRSRSASKRDWPNVRAYVGSKDGFLVAQELGGEKLPKSGRSIGVPTLVARGGQFSGTTPRSKWPGALLRRRKFFLQRLVSGRSRGRFAVLRRVERDRYPLQVVYLMREKATIRPRFGFVDQVGAYVRAHLSEEFKRAMTEALGSSS